MKSDIKHYIGENQILILNNVVLNRDQSIDLGESCKIPFGFKTTKEQGINYKVESIITNNTHKLCGEEVKQNELIKDDDREIIEYEDGLAYGFMPFQIPENYPKCNIRFNLLIFEDNKKIAEEDFNLYIGDS